MGIQVEIEGRGQVAEFPDGTDQAIIDQTIQRDFFPKPKPSLFRKVVGAVKPLAAPIDMAKDIPPQEEVPWMPTAKSVVEPTPQPEIQSEVQPVLAQPTEYVESMFRGSPLVGLAKKSQERKKYLREKEEVIRKGEPSIWKEPSTVGIEQIPGVQPVAEVIAGIKSPEKGLMEAGYQVTEAMLIGKLIGAGVRGITKLRWWRMLSNKERGLVVQSVEDMVKAREAQTRVAELDIAKRLGPPPQAEEFTDINQFGVARAHYETLKSDLMKDYPAVPTEGQIARTVDEYGKKLATERMNYEGKKADETVKDLAKKKVLVKEGEGYVSTLTPVQEPVIDKGKVEPPTPTAAPTAEPPLQPSVPSTELPPTVEVAKPSPVPIVVPQAEVGPELPPTPIPAVEAKPEIPQGFVPLPSEAKVEPIKPKTSEEAQKAIDDKIDELMVQGMTFEQADNAPEVKELFKARDEIDQKDLVEWRQVVVKDIGLPKDEVEGALGRLGIGGKEELGTVYMTAKGLREWGRDTLINLKDLYNHFSSSKADQTVATFRWGGTADEPVLQGSLIGGKEFGWDEDALKKTEKVFNAISKTQGLDPIDLSRIPKPQVAPQEAKPTLPPIKPLVEGKVPEEGRPIRVGLEEKKPKGLSEVKKDREKAIIQEIAKMDAEEAANLPPEEFPIMKEPEAELKVRAGPGAKTMGTVETPPDISQLKDSIKNLAGGEVKGERGLRARKLSNIKTSISNAFDTVAGLSKEAWDWYSKRPEWTDYKDAKGKYLGGRQAAHLEAHRFAQEIQKVIPAGKQEAITNWVEANGDVNLLTEWAENSNQRFEKGYRDAIKLTPEERIVARNVRQYFDAKLKIAEEAGILESGLENYVSHIYQSRPKKAKRVMAEINSGMFKTNPSLARRRFYETLFDAEQEGLVPEKRVGYLIVAYEEALDEAIRARAYVKSMLDGTASDGRPLTAVSGGGTQLPRGSDVPEAYLIRPKTRPKETWDYRYIDHPAFRKWKWAAKDADGNPIFVEGNIYVHPEVYHDLKNVLSVSAVRQYRLGRAVLSGMQTLKSTLLSLSGFHQVQEGTHAIFHKVNAFHTPSIDLQNEMQRSLVDHGLMIYDHNALDAFGEGLAAGGLTSKIPIVGELQQKYGEYLFQDYIPRLKMKMALDAYERNVKRYKDKLDDDQILELTSEQANAAFGELNYKMMGRNPTVQDIFRLMALAPDFLEARARFAGQAVKPYGKEQFAALFRGAMAMTIVAGILNMLFSDDHDPHLEKPMVIVVGKKEFMLRSVPGDILHLIKDPRGFVYNRLNPTVTRTLVETVTGRDRFGNKVDVTDQVKDFATNIVPIPAQGAVRKQKDWTLIESVLQSMGIGSIKHKTAFERYAVDIMSEKMGEVTREEREKLGEKRELIEGIKERKPGAIKGLTEKIKEKEMTTAQGKNIMRRAIENPTITLGKRMSVPEILEGWDKANDTEKKILKPLVLKKWFTWRAPLKEKIVLRPKLDEIRKWDRALPEPTQAQANP